MNLPAHQHSADCQCYTQDVATVFQPQPLAPQQSQPQVVHIHQAAPDRVLQRVALGAGIGAGTVATAVVCGPLLVAAMTSVAISLAVLALVITVSAWAVTTVVRSVGGTEGQAAAKAIGKARRRG